MLEKLYDMEIWPEDPYSEEGRRRYDRALEHMRKLIKHPFIKEVSKARPLRVLELCGGTGIGGVALAKALSEEGIEVDLLITDLREKALEVAKKWALEVLGREVRTRVLDARRAYEIGEMFNIVLIYGLSMAHFSPWEFTFILASSGELLQDGGIFIVDQVDIRLGILMRIGYKALVVERATEDGVVISLHAGYDVIKGTAKRLYLNLFSGERVMTDICYWGLAEIATLMWLFFKSIDFIRMEDERYFILGREPRRRITVKELEESMPPRLRIG